MYKITTRFMFLLLLAAVSIPNLFAGEVIKNASSTSNDMLIAQINKADKYLYGLHIEAPDGASKGAGIATNPRIKILSLGPVVNSEYDDYAPTVTGDGKTIYFVSNRAGSKITPHKKNSTDFWAIKKEKSRWNLRKKINKNL